MALQKRSRLHKLLLTFDEDGKYVTGETLFQEGAWNTETEEWEGLAVQREYPLHNMDPVGKKFLNDVITVAATKALETAGVAAEHLAKAKHTCEQLARDHGKVEEELRNALGARDNFAKLHKEAKAEIIQLRAAYEGMCVMCASSSERLDKIPRLIRRMFGAI